MESKKVIKEASELIGTERHLRKLQEEMGELIAAINQFITCRGKGNTKLHKEFVDVENQMAFVRPLLDQKRLIRNRQTNITSLKKKVQRIKKENSK